MNMDQQRWQEWAQFLHRWGLERWAAIFLESTGPLSVLAAQIVYVSQPLLKLAFSQNSLEALARLLDDPQQTKLFVTILREGKST
jgi:hypothetical protein